MLRSFCRHDRPPRPVTACLRLHDQLDLASHHPGPSSPPPLAACLGQTDMSTVLPTSSSEAPHKIRRLLWYRHGMTVEADAHVGNGLLPFKSREVFGVLLLSHRPLRLPVAW
ncbi:Os08g0168932 [Oryza sativa Japonica Group]|uniref:Os08g0168932 protein n=1 Tax=Oryza sativa subsp. japonica TaxID=39947 RepID=Q6Z032_ORYSJ|nr:hypothetical protein [Oryza sativa Japonica Group]BAD05695.1 hypothetical protein [Oryza sativa Japonica Group]BAH94132.1 Os08g0168932 [Oryza sativa Japonica Group]|eukprot:NP_001175404.1 Os08g0168932 [Oryza sativa Japonica Group]